MSMIDIFLYVEKQETLNPWNIRAQFKLYRLNKTYSLLRAPFSQLKDWEYLEAI